jgi:hypothetical protein
MPSVHLRSSVEATLAADVLLVADENRAPREPATPEMLRSAR